MRIDLCICVLEPMGIGYYPPTVVGSNWWGLNFGRHFRSNYSTLFGHDMRSKVLTNVLTNSEQLWDVLLAAVVRQIPSQLRAWDVQWWKHLRLWSTHLGQEVVRMACLIYLYSCMYTVYTYPPMSNGGYVCFANMTKQLSFQHDTCNTMGPWWTVKTICWVFLLVTEHLPPQHTHKRAHTQTQAHTHTNRHTVIVAGNKSVWKLECTYLKPSTSFAQRLHVLGAVKKTEEVVSPTWYTLIPCLMLKLILDRFACDSWSCDMDDFDHQPLAHKYSWFTICIAFIKWDCEHDLDNAGATYA